MAEEFKELSELDYLKLRALNPEKADAYDKAYDEYLERLEREEKEYRAEMKKNPETAKILKLEDQIEKLEDIASRRYKDDSLKENLEEKVPGPFTCTRAMKYVVDDMFMKDYEKEVQGVFKKAAAGVMWVMSWPLTVVADLICAPNKALVASATAIKTTVAKAHNRRIDKAKAKLEFLNAKHAELTNGLER